MRFRGSESPMVREGVRSSRKESVGLRRNGGRAYSLSGSVCGSDGEEHFSRCSGWAIAYLLSHDIYA